MEELSPQQVGKRSIRGVFAFVSRSAFIQGVNFIRDVTLAALLSPAIFGIYFIVEGFVGIMAYISDIGLGGALIQKKDAITDEELSTTFVVQEGMILTIVILVFIFSENIKNYYNFPSEAIFLFQAFIISFFISTLKTIPSILLERNLEYDKFAIPQVVETLCYTSTLIILALNGWGINSFSYAVLVRAITGLVTMYIIKPWIPKIGFSRKALSHLLTYGIPYQANSILALIKDNLLISVFLGRVLQPQQLGYISFGQKWAYVPLRIVTDNISRITFSTFARLQHDKNALGKAFEKSLFASTSLVFPGLVGLVVMIPFIFTIIPRYQKWEPAYLTLVLFAINIALASILIPITNLLNAIGKIKISLYFMIAWTVFIWVATPIGIHFYGYNAFAAITALINLSVVPLIIIAKKYVNFSVISAVRSPFISSVIMGVVLYTTGTFLVQNMVTLILNIMLGVFLYCAVFYFIGKDEIKSDIAFIRENLKK